MKGAVCRWASLTEIVETLKTSEKRIVSFTVDTRDGRAHVMHDTLPSEANRYPVNEVLAFFYEHIPNGDWVWWKNTACKYVRLVVDMQNKTCNIYHRYGEEISFEQLKYQYGQEES